MNNKTLRDLKEGDRFRFPGDPETRVRTLSQKGKVEGYCPYDGQNTMGHSKEGGEEVYLLGTKVVPIGNKEYANNKTLAARIGNEVFPINEQETHVYYCGYWEEIYLDSVKAPYIHPPHLDIVHVTIVPAENKVENEGELKCTGGDWQVIETGGIIEPYNITNGFTDIAKLSWGIKSTVPETIEEVKANAYLLASSKDLYKALDLYITRIKEAFTSPVESNKNRVLRNEMNGALYQIALKALQKANPNYK